MQISIDDRKFWLLAILLVAVFVRDPLIAALLPFLLALSLAAVIEPAVNFLEHRARLPRVFATIIGLLAIVLAGGYIVLVVATKVLSELIQMGALLQRYQRVPVDLATRFIEELNRLNELVDQRGLPQAVQDNILQAVDDLTTAGLRLVTEAINLTINAATKVPSFVLILVIAMIATFFLLKDKNYLIDSTLSALPDEMRDRARAVQQRIIVDLVGFIKAQLILLSLTTGMFGIGFVLIGINYWMTLALLAGILDIIPVVGPGFLLVPWAIGAWAMGLPDLAVKLTLLYVIAFLVRQIFQAKILGDSIGVHPLPMLAALYAGIHFFGVIGFIVAPILVIVFKGLYSLRTTSRS